LKLIAEDSAANRATRKSSVRGIRASKQNPPAWTGASLSSSGPSDLWARASVAV